MEKRYVVLRDKNNSYEYSVVEVRVKKDSFKSNSDLIDIYFGNGKSKKFKRDWIYKTREEAFRVSKERFIIDSFKEDNKTDKVYVCSSCGRHVTRKNITVDHIKPLKLFKKDGQYLSSDKWQECWDTSNLTLMCIDCNTNKSTMGVKKHLMLNKRATYIKLRMFKKQRENFRKCSMDLARRDSRILDKNTILKQKPQLWDKIEVCENDKTGKQREIYERNRC